MSTYINPNSGHFFRVDAIEAPNFLKEFLHNELVVKNLSQRTVNNYYVQLRAFLRWVKCRDSHSLTEETFQATNIADIPFEKIATLDIKDIHAYLSFCSTVLNNSPPTRAVKLTAIKAFYGYFHQEVKTIPHNPAITIKAPKKDRHMPKYLSLEESKSLLCSCDGDHAERDFAMGTLFINCGMRLSELVGMNLKDIREDTLRIFGKGRKERIVYLNEACLAALKEYLEVRAKYPKIIDKDAVFISHRTGKRLSPRRIEQLIEEGLKKAGLSNKGYSTHKLRATAATLMYQHGNADILALQQLLGHESVKTTQIYTNVSQQQVKAAVQNAPLSSFTREAAAGQKESKFDPTK